MSDNIQHGFKPPRMSGGRAFTDFRPNCNMNKILQNNNASPSMFLDYAKDLAAINEYMMSEKVLTDIINANIDGKIVTQAVFEIAKLFEAKMIIRSDLPLSGFYPHNPFFSSPYLPIQEKASISLESAMAIYDSLRISKKNAQAKKVD